MTDELAPQYLVTVTLDPETGIPQATQEVEEQLKHALRKMLAGSEILGFTVERGAGVSGNQPLGDALVARIDECLNDEEPWDGECLVALLEDVRRELSAARVSETQRSGSGESLSGGFASGEVAAEGEPSDDPTPTTRFGI